MTDNVIMITLSQIISKVSVWVEDNEEPYLYEYKINSILYSFNNHYKARPITFRHRHSSEYIKLQPSPPDVQVLKIFIDLYYDDFGQSWRSIYSVRQYAIEITSKIKESFFDWLRTFWR